MNNLAKKRIGFITSGVGVGGAEKQLAILAQSLKSCGYEVILISLTRPSQANHQTDFDGLDVIFVEMNTFFRVVIGVFRIRKVFAKLNPDYIHGWMFAGNIIASLVGLMFGYKFFHSIRALTWTRSVTDFKYFSIDYFHILHLQSSQIATEALTIVFPSVSQKKICW